MRVFRGNGKCTAYSARRPFRTKILLVADNDLYDHLWVMPAKFLMYVPNISGGSIAKKISKVGLNIYLWELHT